MNLPGRDAIHDRYRAANPRSLALFERAQGSLPGGNTRTTIYYQPFPLYFDHGVGPNTYDVDGNRRLDFINNYTSLIHGHAHPKVTEAAQAQLLKGVGVAAPSEPEILLAEEIKRRLSGVEYIRFTNSGTEGTMMAIRAARAFTRKEKIAKFDGGYHGTHDYAAVNVSAAGAVGTGQETRAAGLPAAVAASVVTMPFNDRAAVTRVLETHKDELAAVIVEPVMGAAGIIIPQDGFLQFLREITRQLGILLIFDEVIAFRISYHGAQGHFGVKPDLTTLGKIIGGGLPVGAFGGRAEIMAQFDPRQPNYIGHGGTFNANPITMAAGLATLTELTPDTYDRLATLAGRLKEELSDLFAELGIPAQVNQIGSLFNIHFTEQPVTSYGAVQAGDRELQQELFIAALNNGIAFTGRGMGCLSTPMGDAEIDAFVNAIKVSLEDLGLA